MTSSNCTAMIRDVASYVSWGLRLRGQCRAVACASQDKRDDRDREGRSSKALRVNACDARWNSRRAIGTAAVVAPLSPREPPKNRILASTKPGTLRIRGVRYFLGSYFGLAAAQYDYLD